MCIYLFFLLTLLNLSEFGWRPPMNINQFIDEDRDDRVLKQAQQLHCHYQEHYYDHYRPTSVHHLSGFDFDLCAMLLVDH